jgi:hypothetical protein
LLFATVAVTASDQFLSFDYIGPMSGTLGKASPLYPALKESKRLETFDTCPLLRVRKASRFASSAAAQAGTGLPTSTQSVPLFPPVTRSSPLSPNLNPRTVVRFLRSSRPSVGFLLFLSLRVLGTGQISRILSRPQGGQPSVTFDLSPEYAKRPALPSGDQIFLPVTKP